ncbi:MAG: TRAP transporter large permease [Firmicutes bacterium]|nr:TRAP transporter large permease [Bacillota bacterium]
MIAAGTVLIGSFFLLLFLGMPIAYAMGVSSLFALWTADLNPLLIPQRLISGTQSFSLLAVPFFVLAGELMHTGGLSRRLVNVAHQLVGFVTGGMAMVTVLASMFFAALSGSAPATTAAIGSVMIPEMERRGYPRAFAAALATASGPLGQMIPPSIPMVIWGVMANVSITRLFLAGIGPGLVMGAALMAVSYVIARRRGYTGSGERPSLRQVARAVWEAKWALMAPLIILGGIYGGVFTPTEAAAVAVVYGLIVGAFVHRELRLSELPRIFIRAMATTTMVVFVISTASVFGWLVAAEEVAQQVVSSVFAVTTNPVVILLLMNAVLLVLGMIMDNIAAMVILSSVLTSVAASIGIDPVQFGTIVVINFAIGMATPPVGYSLFVGASVSGLSIEQVAGAIWPFLLVMVAGLLVITFVPPVTLFFAGLV